jgi:DNA helicase-2/ATP-dependent DNA helicase PcrA
MLKKYEKIVLNFNSPTLVRAGPGSGKTTLLADRIKLLLDKKTDKNKIIVLTYNRDTKKHLYDKLVDKKGNYQIEPKNLPKISTMHALGFDIIKEKPSEVKLRKTNLNVQDNEDVKKLLYRDAALIFGFIEEDCKKAHECKQRGDCRENSEEKKCNICNKYWEIMSKCNYIDFDDQILFACRILEKNPDILEKYQSKAEHLIVDEYQDINAAQFKLIELLSKKSRNNLFVAGDDAQTIYAFRGCDPKFILRFDEDFPGAKTPPLPYSHRCHEKTMNDAGKILEKYYKEWKRPKLEYDVKDGEEPEIWQWPSERSEAFWVARVARRFISEKKTVLILAPKKEFFPLISEHLSKQEVPYTCQENLLPGQINKRINAVNHFVKWLTNPSDNFLTRLVIEELINTGIAKVPGASKNGRCSPETITKRISEETEIAMLWELVDRNTALYPIINKLETQNKTLIKIREGLSRLTESYNYFIDDNRGEFIKQLFVVSGIWNEPSIFMNDISSVVELLQSKRPMGTSLVQLMTLRKAKGLEADIVIIVGLENDVIPNPNSDIVEEARLFFVSMTRAIDKVLLFHSWKRPRNISYGKEIFHKKRSGFLDVIGKESKEYWPRKKAK